MLFAFGIRNEVTSCLGYAAEAVSWAKSITGDEAAGESE